VKRVLARHRGVAGWPGEPRVQAMLWNIAATLLPDREADMRAYTQGMMDVGATICTRTRPHCDVCPVAEDCVARAGRRTTELPTPRPRKALPQRAITVLLLERDGEILLERRPAVGIWSGLWSLPELSRDVDVATYVSVHLRAEAGALEPLPVMQHGFTHFALAIHPVRISIVRWPLDARMPGAEWFEPDAAIAAAIPSPIRRLLRSVQSGEFALVG